MCIKAYNILVEVIFVSIVPSVYQQVLIISIVMTDSEI